MQTIPPGQRVLLVEDERDIANVINVYLKREGFVVRHAEGVQEALQLLNHEPIQLAVLDLMLPDGDGMDLCEKIRQHPERGSLPIIMLTARDEDEDKIAGLEMGADDYMTKPFNVQELTARIKALLRRARTRTPSQRTLQVDDITINQSKRELIQDGKSIALTPKEFDLLWEILDADGSVLTRDKLLETVWGYTYIGDTRTVDVHVRQLRRKLGDDCPIDTVWGKGYRSKGEITSLAV